MLTPWGYEVDGSLPPIVSVAEFNTMTGNRFASDPMLATTILAASAAIRDYCGWHVAPSLTVTSKAWGGSRFLFLPWMAMTAVQSVKENGVEIDPSCYDWQSKGIIRRRDGFYWCDANWSTIEVTATAGYSLPAAPILAQAVVQLVSNSMAGPLGVKEEHAGEVGITYSNPGGGITMTPQLCACLSAYKLEEVA